MKQLHRLMTEGAGRNLMRILLSAGVLAAFLCLAPVAAFAGTIAVDRFDDAPGASACTAAANDCSLRGAITNANANTNAADPDTIILPPGVYRLTVVGTDNTNAAGDLDITDHLTIIGAGGDQDGDASQTVIQSGSNDVAPGSGIDTIMSINPNWTQVLNVTVKAVTLRYGKNTSTFDSYHWGGAIDFEATPFDNSALSGLGSLTIYNSIFTYNSTQQVDGGAISVLNSLTRAGTALTITNSVFANNSATGGSGGAIATDATFDITGTTFEGNAAVNNGSRGGYGGAISASRGGVITNSTFSGNTLSPAPTGRGAGLLVTGGLTMTNVTLSSNTGASQGGGIWVNGNANALTNITVTGNTGTTGSGVYWGSSGTLALHNSIVWSNDMFGAATTSGNNLIGTDPLIGPLADNGGLVKTHALLAGSPAIDAGDDTKVSAITSDARGTGFPRKSDGDGNGTATVDIGAYEQAPAAPDLSLSISSGSPFDQGQADVGYMLSVTNTTGPDTADPVTVNITLGAGLSNPRLSGSGWSCNNGTLSCTRNDALAGGGTHPGIALLVDVAANAPSSVTVSASLSMTGDPNLSNNAASKTVPVRQSTATTVNDTTVTYGGTLTLSASVTPGVAGTVAFSAGGLGGIGSVAVNPATGVATTSVLAGFIPNTHTLTAAFTPTDSGGYLSSSDTATLTINKAPLAITAEDKSRTYGAANPTLTAGYAGFVFSHDASILTGTLSLSTTATATSVAGTYPITVSGFTSDKYEITYAPGTLTVAPTPLTVTANDASRTYGAANPAFSVNYTGFVNGETAAALGGTLSVSTTAVAGSPVSTYAITPSGLTSSNYAITFVDGTLTVSPAPLTVTAQNASRAYGSANPAFTVQYSGFVLSEDESDLGGALAFTAPGPTVGAGLHAIEPSGLTSANYAITFVNGTLTITKAPVTVKADDASRVYGAADPTFTASYTGLVNGETAAGLGFAPSFSTAALAASSPGTYTITPSGLVSNNYTFTYDDGTLTVTRSPLTIGANDVSRTYGVDTPAFTASYTGFVLGETEAVLGGTLGFATAATAASPVGTYTVTPEGLTSPNYAITFTDGTLTVTQAPLTVTAEDKVRVFGLANPPLTVSYTGLVLGETEAVLGGTLNLSTTATPASVVGTYPITVSGLTSTNYAITFVPGTLTVTNATLTIRAEEKSRTYGDPNPAFTVTYSGFVGADTPAVLTGTLNLTTPATQTSPVGTYAITPSGLTATNYQLVFETGTLTVAPRPLMVRADSASRTYGGANPPLSGSVTGTAPGDVIHGSFGTSANATSPVGEYPIYADVSVAAGSLSNYALQPSNGVLTVRPAPLTIQVADASRIYGQANPTFDATVTGLLNGDQVDVALATTATAASGVGTYPITGEATGATANYTVTVTPGTLTIHQASLTVTAEDATKLEGEPNPPLKGTVTGALPGDAIHASFATTADRNSPPGTYPITAELRDPRGALRNYSVTTQQGTLTITGCDAESGQDGDRPVTRNRCRSSRAVEEEVLGALPGSPGDPAPATVALVWTTESMVEQAIEHAQQSGSSDPPRLVVVQDGEEDVTGGIISQSAVSTLAAAGGELQVRTRYGALLISAQTLQQLADMQDDSRMVILFQQSEPETPADQAMEPASPVIEVIIATLAGDGSVTEQHRFTGGLILDLPVEPGANGAKPDLELAGIYHVVEDENGNLVSMEYVGGEVDPETNRISAYTDHLSKYGVIIYDREYADVPPEHWAHRAVKVMTARHVVRGISDQRFDPDRPVTRAEFATMMARAFRLPAATVVVRPFADVAPDAWHAGIMKAVVEAGLFTPEHGNLLRPDAAITREEMAEAIARAMERFYPQVPLPTPNVEEVLAPFQDAGQVSLERRDEMARLVASGLVKGRAVDRLAPQGTTTRAEAVTLIKRLTDWGKQKR